MTSIPSFFRRFLFLVALFCLPFADAWAGYSDPTVSIKVVSSASGAHQPILTMPVSGTASATLQAQVSNFTPTSFAWSQVPAVAIQNGLAANATATLSAATTVSPEITVTFPAAGVYAFQVTGTNGAQSASNTIWIQVWEAVTGLNPLYRVGRNPGLAPPSSVRQFSADPGPYCHPRLFFSRADWPELSGKTAATEVSTAIAGLQSSLAGNFDKVGGVLNTFAGVLAAYADGGYDATYFTNTVQPAYTAAGTSVSGTNLLGRSPNSNLPDALLAAAYVAWVGTDPTLPQNSVPAAAQNRFRYLAKVTAAAAKVELAIQANNFSTNFAGAQKLYDLAVVYDLLYDWMTPQQQADTRDYLYAIGYGVYNTYYGGISRTYPGPVPFGKYQNGDFPNLADGCILPALVIEGEESSVSAAVQSAYGAPSAPATGPNAWPNASPASVNNLYRQCRWLTEAKLTFWGTPVHHHAYLELSMAYMAPSMLALARRGQNAFVTTNLYQASLSAFNLLYTRQSDGRPVLWDHHDSLGFGNGPGSNNGRYILKYMYPDDPVIDYTHRAFRNEGGNNLAQAMFGLAPGTQNLASVAQSKSLPLTRFDPVRGAATTRNSWAENDLQLYFECRPDVQGHMHAEANTFSLYALGRAWSSPPGYHCTINDLSATVLIQNPTLASDPATQGYIGESPSSATTTTTRGQFPTPPAKFLEATEDPGGQWTLFAGDATTPYNYAYENSGTNVDTGKKLSSYLYDGTLSTLLPAEANDLFSATLSLNNTAYNPVQYAIRSVFSVRGARPYVLVLDDITVDGATPRNFRWNMPAAVSFGPSGGRFVDGSNNSIYSSMAIQPGATATEAVLYHSPIDDGTGNGKPRLLVRDVTEQSTAGQPAIILDKRPSGFAGGNLTYGFDNNSQQFTYVPSSRLLITRQNVVSPGYKVLLFPYLTGEATPATSWDANQNVLSINLQNGFTDRITLDKTAEDRRTRVTRFTRTKSGRAAPVLNLPADLVIGPDATAFNGQPGGTGIFTVTATDDTGAALTPSVSSPSGTIFPIGVNVVKVTAADAQGQVTSGQFTVTVTPAAPEVTVTSVTNLPTGTTGISLRWTSFYGATAYSVKRATQPGGPYTVVADRQAGTVFTDGGLNGTGYYYVVTAWLNTYEGPGSAEIPLAGDASPFTGRLIGTPAQGYGFYRQGSNYLLTCTGGQIGNFSDQTSTVTLPWTGDGSFTTRIVSVTGEGGSVSAFGSYGVVMRQSTTANDLMASSAYNTFVAPLQAITRSTAGAVAAGSGPFSRVSYATPIWVRLVRSGNSLTAFYSLDGVTFTQTAASQTVNFTANTLVGLAAGGQNTTRTSIAFDNVVFLGTPVANVTGNAIQVAWQTSPGLTYRLQRATDAAGPFATIATGLTTASYTDTDVSEGTTYYYTVATSGPDGGATVSPAGSRFFPAPVTAPTNLTLTPGTGQIVLAWTGGAAGTAPLYTIERASSPDGPFTTVASGLTQTTYTDTGFRNGQTYSYRVVAANGRNSATSSPASAAGSNGTFTKANNTTALDTAGSWSPASIPGAGDTIVWTGSYSNGTVSAGAGVVANQMQLTSPSTAVTITAGTGPLTLGAGGLDLSVSTQNLTIHAPVALAASQTWNVKSGLTATVNGNVAESTSGTALTKAGPGVVALNGTANSWTGGTAINGGILQIGNNTAASFLPGATIASGAILRFQTTSTGTISGAVEGAGTLNQNSASGVISLSQPAGTRTLGAITGVNGGTLILAGDAAANTTVTSNLNNGGFNVRFNGGNWTLNGGGGYATNLEINAGTVLRPTGTGDFYSLASLVVHGGQLTSANTYGMRMGSIYGANNASGNNFTGLQDGGTVIVSGSNPELGSASANINAAYTLSGGLFSVTGSNSLKIGAATTGTGASTFTLSGGKLLHGGTIQGVQGAGAVQVFAFSGGTLATGAFNATNLRSTAAGAAGTLSHSGGTLAPGDDGTAGRTQITGAYSLGEGGTLSVDVGGTTQATGFQTGQYDVVTVTSTTALAGNLRVRLINGFTPLNSTVFTIVTSTGTLSGAFANVAFNSRVVTSNGEGSFLVTQSGNTVRLSDYTAHTALQTWRFQNFGTVANTGNAADLADPDADGLCNALELALGGLPLQADMRDPVHSMNAQGQLQLTFLRASSGATYIVQGSNDLTAWSAVVTNPGSVGQSVTVASGFPFMRLWVTIP